MSTKIRDAMLARIQKLSSSDGMLLLPEILGAERWVEAQLARSIRLRPGCIAEVLPHAAPSGALIQYPQTPDSAMRRQVAEAGVYLCLTPTGVDKVQRIAVLSAAESDGAGFPRDFALAVYNPHMDKPTAAAAHLEGSVADLDRLANAISFARAEADEARRLRLHLSDIDKALGALGGLSFNRRLAAIRALAHPK